MNVRRCLALVTMVGLLCLLLSGCNFIAADVENQLIPPQNDKEQNAMQTALYDYLQTSNFTLTYPTSGVYQTPFIILDQIKPTEVLSSETSAKVVKPDSNSLSHWGIVLYRFSMSNVKTRINLLKKNQNGAWESVADVEGFSEDVAEVQFADLNGDGFPELLVGWNMYNTTDKRLAVYRVDQKLATIDFEYAYTSLLTVDMTDDKSEDLLFFNISSGEAQVKAKLYSFVTDQMQFRGETQLDRGIKQIGASVVSALSPTVNGAFVDCYKDADTTITELIYWNNSSLESPFSDDKLHINTMTARENGLACRDIDGDGAVEWPISKRLGGYEDTALEKTLWQTDWMAYDFRAAQAERKFSSIVNPMDSYMLRLRNTWTIFDVFYDADTHILHIRSADEEEDILQLLATHSDTEIALPEGFSYFDGSGTFRYAVWVNSEILTLEEIQYLFVLL